MTTASMTTPAATAAATGGVTAAATGGITAATTGEITAATTEETTAAVTLLLGTRGTNPGPTSAAPAPKWAMRARIPGRITCHLMAKTRGLVTTPSRAGSGQLVV